MGIISRRKKTVLPPKIVYVHLFGFRAEIFPIKEDLTPLFSPLREAGAQIFFFEENEQKISTLDGFPSLITIMAGKDMIEKMKRMDFNLIEKKYSSYVHFMESKISLPKAVKTKKPK